MLSWIIHVCWQHRNSWLAKIQAFCHSLPHCDLTADFLEICFKQTKSAWALPAIIQMKCTTVAITLISSHWNSSIQFQFSESSWHKEHALCLLRCVVKVICDYWSRRLHWELTRAIFYKCNILREPTLLEIGNFCLGQFHLQPFE